MSLLALSEKILFLLGNWGFPVQAHSNALAMAYDNFLLEAGYMVLHCNGNSTNTALWQQTPCGSITFGSQYLYMGWRFPFVQTIWLQGCKRMTTH